MQAVVVLDIKPILDLLPLIRKAPGCALHISLDKEADVLYVNYERPSRATDSVLTDDDVIVRYNGRKIIGYTVLHISKRNPKKKLRLRG